MIGPWTRADLLNRPWWKEPDGEAHLQVFATAGYLAEKLRGAHAMSWLHAAIYSREDAKNMGAAWRNVPDEMKRPGLSLNVVKAVIQTVQAQTIKGAIRPTFLTNGADYAKQKAIKKVDAFAQGAMYHARVDELAPELSLHALIFGTGCARVRCDIDGKPQLEVALPQRLLFDPVDGQRRNPRVLMDARAVDRDELLANPAYSGHAAAIEKAECPELTSVCQMAKESLVDQVAVVEAWRLPSHPGAGDGRHVVCIDHATLLDEPWERDTFPWVFLRWDARLAGMMGTGIAADLRAIQSEINRLLVCIQEQMLRAGPKVFVQRGSQVNPKDITSRIWDVIQYVGTEPKFVTFATVSPELFEQVDRLYQRAFDVVGVSTAASRGEKPAGVTSGVAIQTATDLQTGRMVAFGQSYERLHVDIANGFLDQAFDWCERVDQGDDAEADADKKAERATRKLELTYPATGRGGRKYLGRVSADEITLARDEYVCEVWPTSKLASSPAARLDQVEQMAQMGWLTPAEARQLLDFPDLQASNNLACAPQEAVEMAIDTMLDDGIPQLPEPWTDPAIAIPLAARAIQRAQVDGVPEARWQLVAQYLLRLKQQQDDAKAQAAAAAAPPPGPQGAPPGAAGPPPGMPAPPTGPGAPGQ